MNWEQRSVNDQKNFDAIVIGSGIGGLTVAALLAKMQNLRVLVLEQHFTAGGFTHSFSRKGKFHWDVGLHYVGDLGEESTAKAVFNYLTKGKLQWQKMPDPFEKFVYPDFNFSVYADVDRYRSDLIEKFPQEKGAIQRYFRDVSKAAFWYGAHGMRELFPQGVQRLLKLVLRFFGAIARQTTQDYMDRNFQDPKLKALLVSQWGDCGLPPSQSCFGIHSVIVSHYFQGGWYPVGGGKAIVEAILPTITEVGGVVLTQQRVTEILVESSTAVGVRVQSLSHPDSDPVAYYAPLIISNAGAFNTYLKFLPTFSTPFQGQIQSFPKGNSAVTLYVGLRESPQCLGFQGENHWIFTSYDHNQIGQNLPITPLDRAKFAYLSFPSLKDPAAKGHTAEIISFIDYDYFVQWQNQPWRRRGEDYAALKEKISTMLIQLVEEKYPGFQDLIAYAELSTPLTVAHFNASDRGAIYGIPCIPERLDQDWVNAKTPIKNLYLTGSDVFSPGIMGALMGGVKTAGIIQGPWGFFRTMATIMKAAKSEEIP